MKPCFPEGKKNIKFSVKEMKIMEKKNVFLACRYFAFLKRKNKLTMKTKNKACNIK